MPIWTDPVLSKSVLVGALHDWWSSNRGPAGVPDRNAFDVFEHKALLPNLFISDVETEPFRIRYRLVGTRIVRNLGVDFTGRYLDELIGPDFATPWVEYYRMSFADRGPVLGSVTDPTASGGTFTYEFGLFPIALGGEAVKQFLALEDYFDFELRSGALVGLP